MLTEKIVTKEINQLKALGVKIVCNAVIGQTYTIDDLMTKGYISDTGMEIAKGIKDKQVILKSIATTINRYGEYLNNTSTKVDNTEGDISSETRRELN